MSGLIRNGLKGSILKPLSTAELEKVHESSLKILSTCGFIVEDEGILNILEQHGATIENGTHKVRIHEELVEKSIKQAPALVSLYDRLGNEAIKLGDNCVYARVPGGATRFLDLEEGKVRNPVLQDVARIIQVAHDLDNISGVSVIPTVPRDVPIDLVDIYTLDIALKNTTKPLFYVCHNESLIDKVLAMAAVASGGESKLEAKPSITVLVEASSPLRIGAHQSNVLKKFAAKGLPVMLHSHNIAGLTCPVTLAGEVLMTNAEMLALMVISQVLKPGLPVIRGMSSSVPNMSNFLNLSGAPEIGLLGAAMAQLAKYYKVPCSMSSGTESKLPDGQASIERLITLMPPVFALSDLINISTIDSKMCFSIEQLIIDDEIMGMIGRYLDGIDMEPSKLALEEIISIGPGGDYLNSMTDHCFKHYKEELYQPKLVDRQSFVNWEKEGAKDLRERARERALNILDKSPAAILEDAIEKELKKIIDIKIE